METLKQRRGRKYQIRVTNQNGKKVNFQQSIQYMDDETREEVHAKMAPCTAQKFFSEYEKTHKKNFGEIWELSKLNPIF